MGATISRIVLVLALFILASCAPRPTPLPPTPSPVTPPPATLPTPVTTPPPAIPDPWLKVTAEARKEGRLTLYTAGFTGSVGQAVAKAFEEKQGIKVELVTGVGAVLLERIKSEYAANKYIADTYDTATQFVIMAKTSGLTEAIGPLPVLKDKDAFVKPPLLDEEGHIVGAGLSWLTPYINTSLVKTGQEPKSYKELLQPLWKGKLVTGQPATDPLFPWLYAAGKRYKVLDDSYFVALAKQELQIAPTVREADAKVVRGEAALRLPGSPAFINPLIKEGAPVRPILMEEGIIVYVTRTIVVMKNAPHPNAARLFMNWLLSPEGQIVYHQAGGTTPLRKDVPDYTAAAGKVEFLRPLPSDMAMEIEVSNLQRNRVLEKLMGLEK